MNTMAGIFFIGFFSCKFVFVIPANEKNFFLTTTYIPFFL
jgi:hypothetical protein